MRAVDTNVLLRLLTSDDARQTAIAEDFVRDGVWVPFLVLAETFWALSSIFGLTPREQLSVIEMLLDHKKLTLEGAEVVASALEVFRENPSLGLSDCLILESARKAGHLPLGTFDRGLAKLEDTRKL
jgi:predicted nucleic-acid-binding protein